MKKIIKHYPMTDRLIVIREYMYLKNSSYLKCSYTMLAIFFWKRTVCKPRSNDRKI